MASADEKEPAVDPEVRAFVFNLVSAVGEVFPDSTLNTNLENS